MDNLKTLRKVVYIVAVIFFIQLIVLAMMLWPSVIHVWIALLVLIILGVYMVSISLTLIKELEKKEKKK